MDRNQIMAAVKNRYHVEDRRHACAVLSQDFPSELNDIIDCLNDFKLFRSEIEAEGGAKSKIANRFDQFLAGVMQKKAIVGGRGWKEQATKVTRTIGNKVIEQATHKVDQCKERVALEVEWNNKDPFFARDLTTFRMLHELDVISVGVIITRMDELQAIFDGLYDSKGSCGRKYGPTTTHWSKLMPQVENGAGGSCPLLLIGIKKECYEDDLGTPSVPKTQNKAGV
jgi:hypothetical protein